MRVPIYQLDAFTTRRFAGNPAAVVVLDRFLDDALLQAVAAENNLAETAFVRAPSTSRATSSSETPQRSSANGDAPGRTYCAA